MVAQKIATCCYCGTKAALVLRGKDSHELCCGTCGAPLYDLKRLPVEPRAKTPKKLPNDPWHPVSQKPTKKMKTQEEAQEKERVQFHESGL